MDPQIFIDRILENESLTSDLEDGPASRLLQWGTGQVRALVEGLDDQESAGAKVNALMAVMRQVTRTANNCAGAATDDLADELGRLLERHAEAFGSSARATPGEVAQAAARLTELPPDGAVTFLLEWLNKRKS